VPPVESVASPGFSPGSGKLREPGALKVTDVQSYVVVPDLGGDPELFSDWQWTFVIIETDDGITSWGESSSVTRNTSLLTGAGVKASREELIGEDPGNIEHIWQKLYRKYTYVGSRGFPTTVLSGVDIALSDLIKGKVSRQTRLPPARWAAQGRHTTLCERLVRQLRNS
jgi:hypothetical protein